jgi:hypothetical protein
MTMVRVYAGDKPDRVVVDEALCNRERFKVRHRGTG